MSEPIAVSSASRPPTVTIASGLLVILALAVLLPVPGTEEIPTAVLVVGYAFAALKLVAAFGLWRCRRWAAILGFAVTLLDALASAPGALFGEEAVTRLYVGFGLVVSIAVLVLLVLGPSRRAYT